MNITEDIMSRDVVTIKHTDSIVKAYRLMQDKDIRHLPVVDENNKVVGMLSDKDVQRAMVTKVLSPNSSEIRIPSDCRVNTFMKWPVYTINEKTQVKAIVEIMIREKISSLVVEDDHGHIEGIVTTTDMLAFILQNMKKISM